MLYKQNLNYNLSYGCLPRAASDNYPESALQDSLLPCQTRTLEEQDFPKGNLGHIHRWGWGREGGKGECIRSPMSRRREEGWWVTHGQRPRQCGSAGKGAGGWCLFPPQTHHCSPRCITSPCKCQQVSFHNSFIMYLLEALCTYISLENTVVMMPRKLYKQFLLKANI